MRDEGLAHVTHLFNAMSPLHHREGSILNAALVEDRLSCGMIYDRRHLSRDAALLALRAKPEGRLVLVSDAVASLGLSEGSFQADGRVFTLKDGTVTLPGTNRLAGSSIPLLDAVRWLAEDTGIPLGRAWRMASQAPARLLGQRRKGELREGGDADIVLLGKGGKVRATYVEGELIHADHHYLRL